MVVPAYNTNVLDNQLDYIEPTATDDTYKAQSLSRANQRAPISGFFLIAFIIKGLNVSGGGVTACCSTGLNSFSSICTK